MSVYFVYRSHYGNPTTLHLKKFPQKSLVQFFQSIWQGIGDDKAAYAHAGQLLGQKVYSFERLFTLIAEEGLAPPADMEGAAEVLERGCYVNAMSWGQHYVQILTDDDELEMALYFFDDAFVKKYPGRTAILLQGDWKLPAAFGEGGFKPKSKVRTLATGTGEGACYLAALQYSDSGSLTDIDVLAPWRWNKVRLPDLIPHLVATAPDADWPWEPLVLRSQALTLPARLAAEEKGFIKGLRATPDDAALWGVFSDWLTERGRPPAGLTMLERALHAAARHPLATIYNRMRHDTLAAPVLEAEKALAALTAQVEKSKWDNPKKSRVRVEEHVAQLCLYTDHWGEDDLYHHWVLFDDLWAAANLDLAHSLSRLASRWDVLADAED